MNPQPHFAAIRHSPSKHHVTYCYEIRYASWNAVYFWGPNQRTRSLYLSGSTPKMWVGRYCKQPLARLEFIALKPPAWPYCRACPVRTVLGFGLKIFWAGGFDFLVQRVKLGWMAPSERAGLWICLERREPSALLPLNLTSVKEGVALSRLVGELSLGLSDL